ncbi:solute carrier family 2, facilitated glucose transporter member 5-like isoform X2 [Ciona intestinalis]
MNAQQDIVRTTQAASCSSRKQKLSWWAFWSVFLTYFAGGFQYGYSLGSMNAAAVPIQTALQDYHMMRHNQTMTENELQVTWVSILACFPVGGIIGSFFVNQLRKFEYRKTLAILHSATVLASILLALTYAGRAFELLIVGRLIIGFVTATAGTGIAPLYMVEVSPRHLRGILGALFSISISLGNFMANIFGLQQLLGNSSLWPVLLFLTCVPSILLLMFWYFMAPGPRSLYFAKQNQAATEALLKKLRKTDDVSEELQDLRDEYAKRDAEERVTIKQILTSSNLRKQVWGTSLVTVGHMITGINAVQVYMGQLFVLSGVEASLIPYFAIAATFVLAAANCIGAKLAVKIASRYLLIFGYLTEAISLVLLTITATTQHLATWISYISIVSAVCFNFGFAIGPGANTLTLVSESFPQSARSAAQSLACFLFWFCFTLVIVVWPYLQDAIGGYSYLVFATLAFMFAAHVYVAIPVTKHRTFLEIEESYKRLKLPCHRLRRRHRASQLTNIPV